MVTRSLHYPLNYSYIAEQETPDTGVFDVATWPTTDANEQVTLSVTLSLNEFVQLASMVDVARDIAYPDEEVQMWWLWLRIFNQMTICEQMIDCIESDTGVQAALNQQIIQAGASDPNTLDPESTSVDDRFPSAARGETIADGYTDCDNDYLWGGVKEIVLRLDDNARNILENAQAIADIADRYVDFVRAIPIIGNLAAGIATQFIKVIPDILDSFNAYSSAEHVEELSCELFEIACGTCDYPTFQQVADTIASHCFSGLLDWETASLATVIADFIEIGSFTPSLVWHSMLMLELYAFYLQGTVNGFNGTKSITMWAKLGEDEPSADWETLCDGCVSPPEFPTLILGDSMIACNLTNNAEGVLLSLGGGNWRITPTVNPDTPTESWGTFQEQTGALFKITSQTRISGSVPFRRYCNASGIITSGSFNDLPLNTNMYGYRYGLASASSPVYEFHAEFA